MHYNYFKTQIMNTFFLILFTFFAAATFAQPGVLNRDNKAQQIESMRVAYITQKLNLSTDEAQRFWPVYNSYRADLKTLRKNFKQDDRDGTPLTTDQQLEFEQKKLDLKKTYRVQFEQAVGKDKFNLLLQVEDKFKKELMQVVQERQDRGNGGQFGRRRY